MDGEKSIIWGKEARSQLIKGMKLAHDAVFQTTTNSDEAIRNLRSPDFFIDSGLSFMREIGEKMHKSCNEGVTFAILLLYKICEESSKYIDNNHCPFIYTKSLETEINVIIASLKNSEICTSNSGTSAQKAIDSAFKWAIAYSTSIHSFEVMSFAFQYAFESARIILLSEALIVEHVK